MLLLNYIEKIPGKIFSKLKPKMVDGTLIFPYKIYRLIFHVIGSLVLISVSHILFIYASKWFPVIIFSFLVGWITYQEFYLHPRKYKQKVLIGVVDWLSWVSPFVVYLIILY
jgi:hypothetical protein